MHIGGGPLNFWVLGLEPSAAGHSVGMGLPLLTSGLLDGDRVDGDDLAGLAVLGAGDTDVLDGLDHIGALGDLAEQGVLGRKAGAGVAGDDEELAAVGVGA